MMDLKPYLNRIRYDGPLVPTIAVLRDIQLAHACSIPFENLDVLLGRGISIDDDMVVCCGSIDSFSASVTTCETNQFP